MNRIAKIFSKNTRGSDCDLCNETSTQISYKKNKLQRKRNQQDKYEKLLESMDEQVSIYPKIATIIGLNTQETRSKTYKEKEREYKQYWNKWKDDETNVVANIRGYEGPTKLQNNDLLENSGMHDITLGIRNEYKKIKNTAVKTFWYNQNSEILEFINKYKGIRGKLIIVGHSRGGRTAINIANQFYTDLLITEDAVRIGKNDFIFNKEYNVDISSNIKKHINYRSDIASEQDFKSQAKYNYKGGTDVLDKTIKNANHTDIDDITVKYVIIEVRKTINSK